MSGRPAKHSLTLRGHRTSVSLETEFWDAFRQIAGERGQTLNDLANQIDGDRSPETGLASAIRVFILAHYCPPPKPPLNAVRLPPPVGGGLGWGGFVAHIPPQTSQ